MYKNQLLQITSFIFTWATLGFPNVVEVLRRLPSRFRNCVSIKFDEPAWQPVAWNLLGHFWPTRLMPTNFVFRFFLLSCRFASTIRVRSFFFIWSPVKYSLQGLLSRGLWALWSLLHSHRPGPVCHNNSVLNHRISIMIFTLTTVLIMEHIRHFIVKIRVKFWILHEHNELQFFIYYGHDASSACFATEQKGKLPSTETWKKWARVKINSPKLRLIHEKTLKMSTI